MRIGLFTNNYRPLVNGLATSVETTARALRQKGHEAIVVAPRYPQAPRREMAVLRVPSCRTPTHHAYRLPFPRWPGTARAVRSLGLDIYHAQHPFLLGAAAGRWARQAARPLVFTYHTRYDRYAHYAPGPTQLLARLALRRALAFAARADLVIAPGPSVARDLRARGLQSRIEILPTGVPPVAQAGRGNRTERRLALHLDGGSPLCLCVGRLAREKNLAFLLAAFALVRRAVPTARLILVGEGDDRSRLERLSADLGLTQAVEFVGSVPHEAIPGYYLAADVFLFPSTSDTQGLVALEALAAGLPVVAVTSEAALDLLRDGRSGLLAPEDPGAFARAVVTLWGQADRRQAMSEAGRQVAAEFTPERCAERLLAVYRELLEAPVGPHPV